MLLEIEDLQVHYGKIRALSGISLTVGEGEIVTLVGANGAGKTTTLKAISGLRPPTTGSIRFADKDITKVRGHKRVSLGLCQVPEGRGIFPGMTVRENIEMGAYTRGGRVDLEPLFALFPRLRDRIDQPGGTLSGGEQQMLAIARAMTAKPRLLLLDEPSMGLAPLVVQQIFNILKEINGEGTTILLVEQNANRALALSDRAYVLETGSVVLSGAASEVAANPGVRRAYLGGDVSDEVSGGAS
jgi:branched-chain amino acid transport system ATP-binding protein